MPLESHNFRAAMSQAAFWSACGSATVVLFSIAASQILLGAAIAAILLSRRRIRLPRVWLPLALFLLGSMISLAASVDPAHGFPQVKKLYVYLTLAVIFTVIRRASTARNLLLAGCALAGIGSLLGIVQFLRKWREARDLHRNFYDYYLSARITGFTSHWMTFSGEQMLVLVVLLAYLLFGRSPGVKPLFCWVGAALAMAAALVLSDTRSAWLAVFAAMLYLAWSRKKVLVLAVPVLALAAFLIAPASVRERVDSIVHPRARDSNDFRVVVWRTGLRIIQAHPWLGLGPEQVHAQFYQWLPPDIPRPLPDGYYGHLHSIYIHYAAERGIPATLMLIWMFGWIVWDCSRALRLIPPGRGDVRFVLHAGIACVIAIMVEGCFELNLGDSEVLAMFLVVTACAYVGVEESVGADRAA